MTEQLLLEKTLHIQSKNSTRAQRTLDRQNIQPETLVISFDMENVFSLPRCDLSSAYYKRKLNVYNLTARVLRTTKGYCAILHEKVSGRAGNDIASCLITLLKQILSEHPEAKHLILWSDSCVPQNRNSSEVFTRNSSTAKHNAKILRARPLFNYRCGQPA